MLVLLHVVEAASPRAIDSKRDELLFDALVRHFYVAELKGCNHRSDTTIGSRLKQVHHISLGDFLHEKAEDLLIAAEAAMMKWSAPNTICGG